MRIATYNVNGVNGRLPRLLEWLEETKPDVACLQEIKTGDATFPAAKIAAAGYGAIWHGQKSHHGVGRISWRRDGQTSRAHAGRTSASTRSG